MGWVLAAEIYCFSSGRCCSSTADCRALNLLLGLCNHLVWGWGGMTFKFLSFQTLPPQGALGFEALSTTTGAVLGSFYLLAT